MKNPSINTLTCINNNENLHLKLLIDDKNGRNKKKKNFNEKKSFN